MNPTVVRAYQYVVALISIHMVVLGAANALRVLAELALGAPSGGFTGLPFLFAEGGSRPLEIHREQMSLALALLFVGVPAWYLHWRSADRAARRSGAERSSDWRSFYLHMVMAVTVLLALGYGARTLSLLLGAALFGSPATRTSFLEPEWPARAAGAAAMALVAAATWWWHGERSERDRRDGARAHAGEIRRFLTYAVLFIVTFIAAFSATFLLMNVWSATVGFLEPSLPPGVTPGPNAPPFPERADILKTALAGTPVLLLAGLVGALYVRRATRLAREPGADGAAERGSAARASFLYLALFIAGTGGLLALATTGQMLLSRLDPRTAGFPLLPSLGGTASPALVLLTLWLLGWRTAHREIGSSGGARGPADARAVYLHISAGLAEVVAVVAAGFALQRSLRPLLGGFPAAMADFSTPLPFLLLFGAAWAYLTTVVRRETTASETPTVAAARRLLSYLFYAVGVAAAAVGIAGAVGVLGSYVLADHTHGPDEIALYLTLAVLGLLTAWYQGTPLRGSPDPAERAAAERRIALSLAVLGGAGAALVFGSGAVFRVVNALLAAQFTTGAAHDLWHLLADTTVGLAVGLFHWRILRADRAHAPLPDVPRPLVLILPTPVADMRQRLTARFAAEGGLVFETDRDGLRDVVRRLDADAGASSMPSAVADHKGGAGEPPR
ncbi:MAG: DUF5671 domain-containing protein [Candidatus Limnocylindria bacterium]